jgi:hypothetical protein
VSFDLVFTVAVYVNCSIVCLTSTDDVGFGNDMSICKYCSAVCYNNDTFYQLLGYCYLFQCADALHFSKILNTSLLL